MSRRPDHIPKRKAFPKAVRDAAWDDADGRCQQCGITLHDRSEAQFDHVIPVAFGGESTLENCAALCVECNQAKGRAEAKMALRADKMGGRSGQYARRMKAKASGKGRKWPSPKIPSRPFQKRSK